MDWRDEAWQHIGKIAARVADDMTRDFLRPALLAAGFDGEVAEQYKVTWVREDGFRPGIFAQEGDGTCAVGYSCPPWPDYVYDKARVWPVSVYTQDEFGEDAPPVLCGKVATDMSAVFNGTPCELLPGHDGNHNGTTSWGQRIVFGAAEDMKPCRPIYCARHYGNVADAECMNAYHCPAAEEE